MSQYAESIVYESDFDSFPFHELPRTCFSNTTLLGKDKLDLQQQSIERGKQDLQALQRARENEEAKLAEIRKLATRLSGEF